MFDPTSLAPCLINCQFSNGLQLNRVLPPGPREYWNQLMNEHKSAPEHQKWMYESDPFAARKAVDERQAKAAKLKEEQEAALKGGRKREKPVTNEFTNAPEVKMAGSLRDKVEGAIKQVYSARNDDDQCS
jgi:ATP-dependent RNA helicase DHX57